VDFLLPSTVHVRLTSRCNMECLACFGPPRGLGDCDVKKLISVIGVFPQYGVRRIVFTGGEPLLVDGLVDAMQAARAVGLATHLSTNGVLLRPRLQAIVRTVDLVALPIDGDSPSSHAVMRRGYPLHFAETLCLVEEIRSRHAGVSVKIGTVAGKWNKHTIRGIASIVRVCRPHRWKLYQAVSKKPDAVPLTDSEFCSISKEAKALVDGSGVSYGVLRADERAGRYLFLNPDGEAVIVRGGREESIGSFFEATERVALSWNVRLRQVKDEGSTTPG